MESKHSAEVPLFHLRNLVCAYPGSATKCLVINELIIPRGKLVFLLGASGTGKSTLLEALGLMNDTIVSGKASFSPVANQPAVDLAQIWKTKDHESAINELRKKYYSFIFQNTNLMENFTAYENICLSGMIKNDKVQEEVMHGAKDLMIKVKLPENEVGLHTMAANLSGGQRQRLAFVRALNNEAGVLFGDEPTGNLDESNANELMSMIKAETSDDRTAIVVSHDVNLAMRHADIIVVMTKEPSKGYGEVLLENIHFRNHWMNLNENELNQFRKGITAQFHSAADQASKKVADQKPVLTEKNFSRSYKQLFFTRESRMLFGKKLSNLLILAAIFFFTFLSIGFANGSLNYLDEKMNSAFVNWISISVPASLSGDDALQMIRENLTNQGNKEEYHYSQVSEYIKTTFSFYDYNSGEAISALGRTVDVITDEKFLREDILGSDNLIAGMPRGFKGNNDIAFIVSKEFLKDFGYPEDAQNVLYAVENEDPITRIMQEELVPIPIRAIVDKLDGNYYFLITQNGLYALGNQLESQNAISIKSETGMVNAFYENPSDNMNVELRKGVENMLSITGLEQLGGTVEILSDTFAYKPGYAVAISFYPELKNYIEVDSVWKIVENNWDKTGIDKDRTYRTFSFDRALFDKRDISPDQLSVYFQNLEKIDDFAKFVARINYEDSKNSESIQVDQNKVKDKKNFLFLSNVAYVISFLLILFATASIGLFINNLVRNHLNKVKMNLGTFKAMGLHNKESVSIYFRIILVFFFIACTLGFSMAFIVGVSMNELLVWSVKSDDDMAYFLLFNFKTALAFVFVLGISSIISYRTIHKILSKSPGDLIYNRG